MTAKEGSSHFIKFTSKNGTNVFELEALEPQVLQQILREAIDSVLNIDAINREIEAERTDAAFLEVTRQRVQHALKDISLDGEHDPENN